MTLKALRKSKNLTQAECAAYLGMPLRTYQNYENDPKKENQIKYRYIAEQLNAYGYTDEEHGLLSIEAITAVCREVLSKTGVEYCWLFGSYAKEKATETSDVDLLISPGVSGLGWFALAEELREGLKKKVDLLDAGQLRDNPELINEILKEGIRIYG